MTEKLTIAEARERGMLDGKRLQPTTPTESARVRQVQAELDRMTAWLRFLAKLGEPVLLEHRFHETRKWRLDAYWPGPRVALEVDGGGWVGGAHHREAGRRRDNKKELEAELAGIFVVRCSWDHVKNGRGSSDARTGVSREEVMR